MIEISIFKGVFDILKLIFGHHLKFGFLIFGAFYMQADFMDRH
jgi:hypothetical protein